MMSMNEELANRIKQCPNLPSLPTIAVQVLDLAQKPDVDITQIAGLISKDPALSGRILRTVNSSFYGRSQNVATISHALVILGLQSVKTLVLGFSLVTHLNQEKPRGFKHLTYWKRSIYAATAARAIAARVAPDKQEEAFLAALLQDIGMLVLDRVLAEEYGQVHAEIKSHAQLPQAEEATFGTNHAAVGEMLTTQWKLPPVLTVPIGAHHAPQKVADGSMRKLADLVSLSGICADVFVDEAAAEPIMRARQIFNDSHQISGTDCDSLLDDIGRSTREVASLFEINIGSHVAFEDVLKRANEALVELTLQTQQKASELQQQNQELRHQATTDPLTGLANRGTFDQFLREQFAAALASGKPLALVMLDVDRFKNVNDRLGHQTGDAVLKTLGKLVKTAARTADLAARYGGEEMALILPSTTRATAAAIAETLRRAVCAKPIACGPQYIPVTVSLGVATLERSSGLKEAAHLIKACDLALYAAKNSGRNCVRVFSVKSSPAMVHAA